MHFFSQEKRFQTSFIDIGSMLSANTLINSKNERFFLTLNNSNISIKNYESILRSNIKRYYLNLSNTSISKSSNNPTLKADSNVIKPLKRSTLMNIYSDIIEKFELKQSTIIIGKSNFSEILYETFGAGYKNGTIFYKDYPLIKPYEALIFSYSAPNFKKYIIIQAPSIEGEIGALREIYNNKDYYEYRDFVEYTNKTRMLENYDFLHFENRSELLHQDSIQTEKLIRKAVFGRFEEINHTVTIDDVILRFRNIRSLVSDKIRNFYDITSIPVVFGGGLWSDIDSWKDLASKLSDEGYDSWMIELTGGPGQDCDDCINYDFDDLTDTFFPAMIGSIQNLKNNSNIIYIGHSNGARTAIGSLEKYENTGKEVGIVKIDNQTVNISMAKKPIKTLVAAGVPGSFEGQEIYPVYTLIKNTGINTINYLSNKNKTHTTIIEIIGSLLYQNINKNTSKISLNLWNNYFDFINSSVDKQIGNISLHNFLIIKGTALITNDGIVTTQDEDEIYEKVNSTNKRMEEVFTIHVGMQENKKIQNYIREFIK
ncbi:hypothetical protein C0585_01400 [Candidatus Woesearchaeota archaeon]|nr:MAG: hypothetical protein C0585_01400 [Candidatus Woesearchaeota archaeon]